MFFDLMIIGLGWLFSEPEQPEEQPNNRNGDFVFFDALQATKDECIKTYPSKEDYESDDYYDSEGEW